VSRLAERDEVHVDALFVEITHWDQVVPAGLVDFDGTTVGCHLLEVTETIEKVVYPWHNEGEVP